jgi:hypothetical protein
MKKGGAKVKKKGVFLTEAASFVKKMQKSLHISLQPRPPGKDEQFWISKLVNQYGSELLRITKRLGNAFAHR